jgi:antirestriction protein ArdC
MPKNKRLTEADRAELRERDRERLQHALSELHSSEGWRAWLRARALLHGYSLRNTVLIAHQAHQRGSEPTYVAGFKTWLRLGRCVRRGEKGLGILAPVKIKPRDEDETEERAVYFRPAYVFDVSQTEPLPGKELIPLEMPRAPVDGESHAHLLVPLQDLAGRVGFSGTYEPLDGVDGLCDRKHRRLRIGTQLAPNGRVTTLIHELAHALVDAAAGLKHDVEEIVVEAVAYIVCAGVGLDTGADSVPYIASWGAENAAERIAETSRLIDQLARRIEDALPGPEQLAKAA